MTATTRDSHRSLPKTSLTIRLQIGVLLVGEGHLSGVRHLLLVLLEEFGVDLHLRGSKSGSCNEFLFCC